MTDLASDASYLADQYSTADKLRIRQEAHIRYSERPDDFFSWALAFVNLQPGLRVADVGCGPGAYHPLLCAAGCRVAALDASWGMAAETQRQAQHDHFPVYPIQAHAEALPLAADAVDRLLANHMLYHVADQQTALREMYRVLKAGGFALLATNAPDSGAVFYAAHCAAAQALGYTSAPLVTSRFHLDHLELVQRVFPDTEVHVRRDAFLFPTLDDALRYYLSGIVDLIEDAPVDGRHVRAMLPLVRNHLQPLLDRAGRLHVPKDAGCFVARKR